MPQLNAMDRIAQLQRMGLFDARVPRYTSYPTAPHFTSAVGSVQMADWIKAIAPGSAISLYLHVPFCRRLCWFCACRTQGTRSDEPVRAYVETLKAEIALLARHLPEGVTLSRMHWGGGTPTLLEPRLIWELAQAVGRILPMGRGGEFSVEIDPGEIDDARLDALAAAGMSRASVGVQDFDPVVQKAIGRDQSYELTHAAVQMIRARGIGSVNADILYGLPHQSVERQADTVQKLLSLAPDRVALYGYAHVPWMARRQTMIDAGNLPDPFARMELFEVAQALFLADGFARIGIDHFARPGDGLAQASVNGTLRRNFQGYTDDRSDVLIALGASGISRFPQGYAQNAGATSDHVKAVREGLFSTRRGHVFTGDDRLRSRMIEALMCGFAIDRAGIAAEFNPPEGLMDGLFARVADAFPGMVTLDQDGLTILPQGRALTRMMAQKLDAYAAPAMAHSSAV